MRGLGIWQGDGNIAEDSPTWLRLAGDSPRQVQKSRVHEMIL